MAAPLSRDRILDAALALAADRHWEALRLSDIAAELGVDLVALHALLDEKEDLLDWLWDRADHQMLLHCGSQALAEEDLADAFECCVTTWLSTLSPHRRSVREALSVRMEPGHLHIQLPTLLRVSRTVQWMRECCGRRAVFLQRAAEETVLSGVFLSTLLVWLNDDSHAGERSRDWLRTRLAGAIALGHWWPASWTR